MFKPGPEEVRLLLVENNPREWAERHKVPIGFAQGYRTEWIKKLHRESLPGVILDPRPVPALLDSVRGNQAVLVKLCSGCGSLFEISAEQAKKAYTRGGLAKLDKCMTCRHLQPLTYRPFASLAGIRSQLPAAKEKSNAPS